MDWLEHIIGVNAQTITWWQMTVRGVIVFFYALLLVRLSHARVFSMESPLDIVVAVILGSSLSRALTGNAPLLPTFAAMAALMLLHRLLAKTAWHSRTVGWLFKGSHVQLVRRGTILRDNMHRACVTEHDLHEALRQKGVEGLAQVRDVYMERNGKISVIKR